MYFEDGYIYHIYNQGNNKQRIFFNRENYIYFLHKIRKHIVPHADILAWCLMPNHFHLMILVNKVIIETVSLASISKNISVAQNHTLNKKLTLNDSIGIMLRSYTQAVNKEFKRSGKLFREKTKAECINCPTGVTPSFIIANGITYFNNEQPERQYPQVCFNYIHDNPVKARLVSKAEDWEFSSAVDYAGLRDGHLINRAVAESYVNTSFNP